MSGTSQKHRNFVAEPMRGKRVTDLAGVGETLGARLTDAGYAKADAMLGKFLTLNRDKQRFEGWMKNTCQANSKQASDCYRCLNDWSEEFL